MDDVLMGFGLEWSWSVDWVKDQYIHFGIRRAVDGLISVGIMGSVCPSFTYHRSDIPAKTIYTWSQRLDGDQTGSSVLENALFKRVCGNSFLITLLYKSPSANPASYSRKINIV